MSTTPDERAEIRSFHRGAANFTKVCLTCDYPWPCPTIRLLDELEAAEAEIERLEIAFRGCWKRNAKGWERAALADELASYVEAQHQALMHPQLVAGCITCDLLTRHAALTKEAP